MKTRIVLSVLLGIFGVMVSNVIRVAHPLVTGNASVEQLDNSNQAYMQSTMIMNHFGAVSAFWLVLIALGFVAIWYKPIKEKFFSTKTITTSAVCLMLFVGCMIPNANAYYDVRDNPEYIDIQPNQSAFLIPMVGANKDAQKKFMSMAYLDDNKVATKRIQIPHTLLTNTALTKRDMYIPASKLYIVDRTPYNRSWVQSKTKGTSAEDEAMYFETNESIDGHTGIAISAYVKEENVAKFLYYFGTKPTGTDDQGKYASVIYGTSLTEVMDKNVYHKVQIIVAREFGKRSVRECVKSKAEIMDIIMKEVKETYEPKGITIDFLGYAEGLTWHNAEVQKAMDSVFVSNMEVEAYPARLKMLEIKKGEAENNIKNAYANAIQKWNGVIPSFFWLPLEAWNKITSLFK